MLTYTFADSLDFYRAITAWVACDEFGFWSLIDRFAETSPFAGGY